ncbi:hypothetical protein HZC32_03605 [Candidatus Woesearchaeota archaeon]|nr:hypothetical protein [Candidatus Woesearchaeota archaeon]
MAKRKVIKRKTAPKKISRWRPSPLKGSFMVLSILGILFSIYFVYPASPNYGTAFLLLFIAMFIASLISMTKAPIAEVKR